MARLEGLVGTAEWIFAAVLTAISAVIGHLYVRLSNLRERVARSEGAVPEILTRIEGTLNRHVQDETVFWNDIDGKVDQLVTDVAVLKNGGNDG